MTLVKTRSYWNGVGHSSSVTGVLKTTGHLATDTQRDDQVKAEAEVGATQVPAKEPSGAGRDVQSPPEGASLADTWVSDFWPPDGEGSDCCGFSPLVCGHLFRLRGI